MDMENIPVKRRKIDGLNDNSEGAVNGKYGAAPLDVGSLSVKPDKIQKLRKIAASCEKIQNSKNDDVVISSVGSSPSCTPCPDVFGSLSCPVDPVVLHAKLAALEREGNPVGSKADIDVKVMASSRDENLVNSANIQAKLSALIRGRDSVSRWSGASLSQTGQESVVNENKVSDGNVLSPSLKDVDEPRSSREEGKNAKMPVDPEEFKALVKHLISEKMKKLEESYTENIIPSLEKKISSLENDNKYLEDRTRLLQNNFQTLLGEYRKHYQKPLQKSIAVQTNFEPPVSVGPGAKVVSLPSKSVSAVHPESIPGLYKPPSSIGQAQPSITSPGSFPQQGVPSGMRYPMISHGGMHTTMAGQPRLYSGVNNKSSSHPNVVVSQRTYQTFVRPNGPITAAVYPQQQNPPVSPSNHNIPRNAPPSPRNPEQTPGGGYIYTQQTSNGVIIRTGGQPTGPPAPSMMYPGNADRRPHSIPVRVPLAPRHQMPSGNQRPPPDYRATVIRQQQESSYQAGTVQMTAVRHYVPRLSGPAPPRNATIVSSPVIQNGPRQITLTSQMTPRSQTSYTRPSGPPPLVRAQPPDQQHVTQTTSPRFQVPAPNHAFPARANGPQNGRINQGLPQNTPSQARVLPPSEPGQVRLQGHQVPPGPLQNPPQLSPTAGGPRDLPPPAPDVSISSVSNGIVLSWNMTIPEGCAPIDSYQLFAYQNNGNIADSPSLWKKLGIVKALPLPMACTLTQFVCGSVYHFAVRAIDVHGRAGNYSSPCAITLPSENGKTGAR